MSEDRCYGRWRARGSLLGPIAYPKVQGEGPGRSSRFRVRAQVVPQDSGLGPSCASKSELELSIVYYS